MITARFAKVHEVAAKYRVSADAVYLWIRQGRVLPDCVVRIGGTIRVDEKKLEQRLRSGTLCQSCGCKPSQSQRQQISLPTGGSTAKSKPEAG